MLLFTFMNKTSIAQKNLNALSRKTTTYCLLSVTCVKKGKENLTIRVTTLKNIIRRSDLQIFDRA